jgi:hypothetical protein
VECGTLTRRYSGCRENHGRPAGYQLRFPELCGTSKPFSSLGCRRGVGSQIARVWARAALPDVPAAISGGAPSQILHLLKTLWKTLTPACATRISAFAGTAACPECGLQAIIVAGRIGPGRPAAQAGQAVSACRTRGETARTSPG